MCLVVLGAFALLTAPGAGARPARYCHGLLVGTTGDVFSVVGAPCRTGRTVGVSWLHHRRMPRGWQCRGRRRNTGASRYAFTCEGPRHRRMRVFDAIFAD